MYQKGKLLARRYRLEQRLGAGGMGEVWRAYDLRLKRRVAVKVVQPALLGDPGFLRRFRDEATAMAKLHHPHIVTIHDFDDDPSTAFLVMEYVPGESLASVLGRERLAPRRTMELMTQAADALQAAHDHGIVHRDVKPANLLVREDGSLLLTDFGVARMLDSTQLTAAGMLVGTPSYLAPEQIRGERATERSDIYSLGVVGYECLTGDRPFDRGNPVATMRAHEREPPPTLPGTIPPAMCEVIERALAKQPADRWPSATEFAIACRDAMAGPDTPPAPPPPPRPEPPTVIAAASVAATAPAGGLRGNPHRRMVAIAGIVSYQLVVVGLTYLWANLLSIVLQYLFSENTRSEALDADVARYGPGILAPGRLSQHLVLDRISGPLLVLALIALGLTYLRAFLGKEKTGSFQNGTYAGVRHLDYDAASVWLVGTMASPAVAMALIGALLFLYTLFFAVLGLLFGVIGAAIGQRDSFEMASTGGLGVLFSLLIITVCAIHYGLCDLAARTPAILAGWRR